MNLGSVQHLFTHDGPFVSVHLDVSRDTEVAVRQRESRWTTTRHELEHAGVAPAVIDAIGERLVEKTGLPGEVRRTVVAAEGEIVLDDARPGHTLWPETVTTGPLPDLAGWLHQSCAQLPFLLVVADREGADLDFYRAQTDSSPEHQEVHGETMYITKVPQGDWAQKQYQQRSENVWRKNAGEVADAVRTTVSQHRPRLVVLAGDERARTDIVADLEHLPSELVQVQSGGRAAGSSEDALWQEVRQVLARVEAEDQQQVVGRLDQGVRQGTGVAIGLDEVLDALAQAQVERLVLDLQTARELTVDPGKHPGLALPESASGEKSLPADQVLVSAGAATDVDLVLMPKEQIKGGGIAAILRWDE